MGSKTHFTQQRQHTLSPSLYLGPYSTGSRDTIVLLLKRSYQFEFYDATPRQRLDEFKALNLPSSTTMRTWIPHHYAAGGVRSAYTSVPPNVRILLIFRGMYDLYEGVFPLI